MAQLARDPDCPGPRVGAAIDALLVETSYFTNSISLGRHCFVKNDSSGLYRRKIVNHPLPGIVWIQLPRLIPGGCFGPK